MADKHVTIVGGGVTGLSAALGLAQCGIHVDVVEKAAFLGGHAVHYTCKATDQCVRCGACMVEERLRQARLHPDIALFTNSHIDNIRAENGFVFELHQNPICIDPHKCTDCGVCFDQCPEHAVLNGSSAGHRPFYSVSTERCTHFKNGECDICQKSCPENAIDLGARARTEKGRADAILMATGFEPYDPSDKPYGYGHFKNVVTNLEMERLLRSNGRAAKPSDKTPAERIAFIQCVGSRDKKLNHLWCSRVCCGSALRMAGLIKFRQPEADITCFYIDIQSFGKDFEAFYNRIRQDVRFIRSIPGDIFEQEDKRLKVIFADEATHESREEIFDMVVLSIGLCPDPCAVEAGAALGMKTGPDGFLPCTSTERTLDNGGVFAAGAATGPMGIAESIASAGSAVNSILNYLGI